MRNRVLRWGRPRSKKDRQRAPSLASKCPLLHRTHTGVPEQPAGGWTAPVGTLAGVGGRLEGLWVAQPPVGPRDVEQLRGVGGAVLRLHIVVCVVAEVRDD